MKPEVEPKDPESVNPSWLLALLFTQLLLTLVAPPLPVGARLLYPGDLFFLAWVPWALWKSLFSGCAPTGFKRRLAFRAALSAALILVTYAHGAARGGLLAQLRRITELPLEPEAFDRGRELILALRFTSWICAGWLAGMWSAAADTEKLDEGMARLFRLLAAVSVLGACAMIAGALSPEIHLALGRLYRYDAGYWPWRGREYGIFGSPLEAGLVLCLSAVLLVRSPHLKTGLRWAGLSACAIGVLLSKTATPVMALAVAIPVLILAGRYPARLKWAVGAGALALAAFVASHRDHPLVATKFGDFLYRFHLWKAYWQAAARRWDYVLVGFGFSSYFADSSYVFLFSRGGALLLGAFAWLLGSQALPRWKLWSAGQRMALAFLLISGLTLDAFIIRPVVAVWICVVIPYLAGVNKLRARTASPTAS